MVDSTACRAPSFSIWARVIMTRSYTAREAGWCVTSVPAVGMELKT